MPRALIHDLYRIGTGTCEICQREKRKQARLPGDCVIISLDYDDDVYLCEEHLAEALENLRKVSASM